MEILFSQRHNFASITPFMDYCSLDGHSYTMNTFDFDLSPLHGKFENITNLLNQHVIELPAKLGKGKRRTSYYYGNESVGERIALYTHGRKIKQYFTENDRHIKKHYGNPYSNIEVTTLERSITRKGDRITIKKYKQIKYRKVNSIYFKKSTYIYSLTFDLKTGNFLSVITSKNGKVKGKQFRTNTFSSLETILNEIMSSEHVHTYRQVFSDDENKAFAIEVVNMLNLDGNMSLYLSMIRKFVELKKIKVPNDYISLLTTHYPTEKFLKKNDRKLVASVLHAIGIKSKMTIKMLHDNIDIDLGMLYWLCNLLGEDSSKYLGNINSEFFNRPKSSMSPYVGIHYAQQRGKITPLNPKDKETLCHILNDFTKNSGEHEKRDNSFLSIIDDHISMMDKIRPFDADICMKAKTWKDFNEEHREFTKIIAMIRKGWVTEYVFNDKMVSEIEKPITIELNIGDDEKPEIVTETFYPYILKREEEYSEEGTFMHHCVATYSDKDVSMIISLRTKDASDRVTCEFTTQTGFLVQARHFCNQRPPEDMMMAVDELKLKTVKYARLGLLNCVEKRKTQVKINGIEVPKPPMVPTLNEHLFNYEVPF